MFDLLIFAASLAAGVIAAISGFGIGSVLTPLVSIHTDTKLAIAIVSIPHLVGTLVRFVTLRSKINGSLARTFGVASAIGGLAGAVLNAYANAPPLTYVLAALLVFAGISGITRMAERLELKGRWKWIAGFVSAVFGGMDGARMPVYFITDHERIFALWPLAPVSLSFA